MKNHLTDTFLRKYFFQFDENCKCNGWKNPTTPPNVNNTGINVVLPSANLTDPCRSCSHNLSDHVSHLINSSNEELNQLLSLVVDIENLFVCVNKEEDPDNKQVYFCLFKVITFEIILAKQVL
jgi:histone acetyltransferase